MITRMTRTMTNNNHNNHNHNHNYKWLLFALSLIICCSSPSRFVIAQQDAAASLSFASSPTSSSSSSSQQQQQQQQQQQYQYQLQHPQNGPRVAIIGFGPGGMFFCHALETKRRELEAQGDWAAIAKLPVVTAFEKASTHGGLWRPQEAYNGDDDNTETEWSPPAASSSSSPPQPMNMNNADQSCDAPAAASSTNETIGATTTTTTTTSTTASTSTTSTTTTTTTRSGMYDALWMNCIKERNELFDHTFEDHFGVGVPLPPYLPRHVIFDYMTKRVTKHCPNFFEKYAIFNTEVSKVTFDSTTKLFTVTTTTTRKNVNNTGEMIIHTSEYEKCIWAAGQQGKPKIPKSLWNVFYGSNENSANENSDNEEEQQQQQQKPFPGRVVHSANVGATLKEDVQDKNVLLVGGSFSAEDLALMSIKLGAKRIFISFRAPEAVVTWQNRWPGDKVELLYQQVPVSVTQRDYAGNIQEKSCINLAEVEMATNRPLKDEITGEVIVETELCDIDTVILCTGYDWNFDMLDASVAGSNNNNNNATETWNSWRTRNYTGAKIELPDDWKMPENRHTTMIGDIKPSQEIAADDGIVSDPYLYQNAIDINNPSMMYYFPAFVAWAASALVTADVTSYLLLKYVSDDGNAMPSPDEMRRNKQQLVEYQMSIPGIRMSLDREYYNAFLAVQEQQDEEYGYGYYEYTAEDWYEEELYHFHAFAGLAREADYPVNYGEFGALNEIGEQLWTLSHNARNEGSKNEDDPTSWLTFRDLDAERCGKISSLFSQSNPRPFDTAWMEIDDLADVTRIV